MLPIVCFRLCSQPAPPRRKGHFTPALLFTALLAFIALGAAPAAQAATYSVSTVAQLDAAVASAQNGDTIQIAAGTYRLDQTLHLQNSVTLIGSGAAGTILDGGGTREIMLIGNLPYINHNSVSLFGLTLRNGQSDEGGALAVGPNATAVLTNCTLSGNTASGQRGGAIYNSQAVLTLKNCTLSGNSVVGSGDNNAYFGPGGGAINNDGGTTTLIECTFSQNTALHTYGGAFYNAGAATLTGCTFAGNSVSNSGAGGAFLNSEGSPVFRDCVFTQNSATYGGAIFNYASATLTGCTVSGNTDTKGALYNSVSNDSQDNIVYAGMTLTDDILYGDNSGAELYQYSSSNSVSVSYCDIQGGVPSGGMNGGVTDGGGNFSANPLFVGAASGNLHLQSGSPCIGAGTANAPRYLPYDRDGVLRPNPPTIGAYEGSGYALVVTSTNAAGPGSLAAAVAAANATPGATITFDPAVFGVTPQTITLGSTLSITARTAIVGPGFAGLFPGVILDGGGQRGIITIASGTPVFLSGLTLQNGNSGSVGGGISNAGALTVTDCAFVNNVAYRGGGGINNGNNATLTLTNCTLSGNSAGRGSGGALYNGQGGTAILTDDILWNDSAFTGSEISENYGGVSATFCDIQNGPDGTGNFSADPLFVNGTTAPYDVHLRPGTPCTGTGTVSAPSYSPYDLDGNSRSNPPTVGAYEGRKINTQTTIASSLNPAAEGQSVTFTATVINTDPNSPAPAGTVQFAVNGTAQGSPVPLGANGMVQFATIPPRNVSSVSASFVSADTAHANSSASVQQIVSVPTMVELESDQNPDYEGGNFDTGAQFTATINSVNPNDPNPNFEGYVDFYVDGNWQHEEPLNYNFASFNDRFGDDLPPGPHTVQAYFYGYDGFLNSSASLIQTTIATVTGVSVGWGKQTAPLTAGAALPWVGIKTLVVTLDGPAALAPGDVSLTGKAGASYGPVIISQSGSVYTVTLAKPITTPDRLTLTIGNTGVNSYSTSFSVLPGDVNGDGAVNASDMALVKNAIGGTYNQTDDIDGSGVVDASDYTAVRQRVGTKLP